MILTVFPQYLLLHLPPEDAETGGGLGGHSIPNESRARPEQEQGQKLESWRLGE